MTPQEQILDIAVNNSDDIYSFVLDAIKEKSIEDLKNKISHCRNCSISSMGCKSTIHGNINADLLVISDYTSQKKPLNKKLNIMNSRAHRVLDAIFEQLEFDKDNVFYANAINCYPYFKDGKDIYDRSPTATERKACSSYLVDVIKLVRPKAIFVMGSSALNDFKYSIPVENKDTITISECHGKPFYINGIRAVASYNLEHILKMQDKQDALNIDMMQEEFMEDLQSIITYIKQIKGEE